MTEEIKETDKVLDITKLSKKELRKFGIKLRRSSKHTKKYLSRDYKNMRRKMANKSKRRNR